MGLFSKKYVPQEVVPQEVVTRTVIELSDESRQSLVALDNDIQVLSTLMKEVTDTAGSILAALHGEIVAQVPGATEDREFSGGFGVGVKVFADDKERVELPDELASSTLVPKVDAHDRIRSTPFTRAPRHVQVEWLKEVMSDGKWYSAIAIAREYATDERHFRYMRSALGGRLREMHEEGTVERRDSDEKGAMFQYRIAKQ